MLEQASLPDITPEQRKALLHIAVVGGGPTGVEFSAEVHDFVEQDVYRMYPHLRGQVKITLYDVAPHILGSFDECVSPA
jgi:NADH dehydrogenase FAD-containing subunit